MPAATMDQINSALGLVPDAHSSVTFDRINDLITQEYATLAPLRAQLSEANDRAHNAVARNAQLVAAVGGALGETDLICTELRTISPELARKLDRLQSTLRAQLNSGNQGRGERREVRGTETETETNNPKERP